MRLLALKHSFLSVARVIADGLETGSVVIRREPAAREVPEQAKSLLSVDDGAAAQSPTDSAESRPVDTDPSQRYRDHLVHSQLVAAIGQALLGACGPFGAPLAVLLKRADELQEWERLSWQVLETKQHPSVKALLRHSQPDQGVDAVTEESLRWIWLVTALLHDVGHDAAKGYREGVTGLPEFQKTLQEVLRSNIDYLSEQGVPTQEGLARELDRLYSDLHEFDIVARRTGLAWTRPAHASRWSVFESFVHTCAAVPTSRLARVFEVLARDRPQSRTLRVEALATRRLSGA